MGEKNMLSAFQNITKNEGVQRKV